MKALVMMMVLLVASAYGFDVMDRMQAIAEETWESEYLPDSGTPIIPLNEFSEFEVIELFRAQTSAELEAAVSEGYPMSWLEETLRDESIPWEDRYWLDRRMRAAIAQNTHIFFRPEGTAVRVDADEIFPGEYYWSEHLIVDPVGRSTTVNETGPVQPLENYPLDSGDILNPYGRRVGTLAIVWNGMSLSRDASIGVFVSGRTGELVSYGYQHYACLLYPDGTFNEIPFEDTGAYDGTVSANGNVLAFFRQGGPSTGSSFIEVMDREGRFLRRIPFDGWFEHMLKPPISADGRYASCILLNPGAHSAVFNLANGSLIHVTEHTGTDVSTSYCSFSPDGGYVFTGGISKGRVVRLSDRHEQVFPETSPRAESGDGTQGSSSYDGIITALVHTQRSRSQQQAYTSTARLHVYSDNATIDSREIGVSTAINCAVVSPNGHYILAIRGDWLGGSNPSPILVLRVEGRR